MIPVTNKVIIPLKEVKGKTIYQMIVHLVDNGLARVNETGFGYNPRTKKIKTDVLEGEREDIQFPSKGKGVFHTHPKLYYKGECCEIFSFSDINHSWRLNFKEISLFNMITKKLWIITIKKIIDNKMLDKINNFKYKDEVMDFVRRHSVVKTFDEIKRLADR